MKTMIEQNNYLRVKLTHENREYYEKLLIYLRVKGNDEVVTEEVLLEILTDIIAAQEAGQTAQQYFGTTPKTAADELLHELNRNKQVWLKKQLSLSIFIFCLMTLLTFMETELNLIKYLVATGGLIILLNSILTLLEKDAFNKSSWRLYVGGGIVLTTYLTLVICSDLFTPRTLIYSLGPVSLWGIVAVLAGYLFLWWKWQDQFSIGLFYLVSLALAATLVQLPLTGNIFQTTWGQVSLFVLLGLGWTVRILKNNIACKR